MPFPTAFPSAAASAIGNAILSRSLDRSLLEPAYDLQGYAEYRILAAIPAPQPPTPVTPAKTFGEGLDDELTHDEAARMLLAASDAHTFGAAPGADKALPWKAILGVLFTIIQGLLLAEQPPIVNPSNQ